MGGRRCPTDVSQDTIRTDWSTLIWLENVRTWKNIMIVGSFHPIWGGQPTRPILLGCLGLGATTPSSGRCRKQLMWTHGKQATCFSLGQAHLFKTQLKTKIWSDKSRSSEAQQQPAPIVRQLPPKALDNSIHGFSGKDGKGSAPTRGPQWTCPHVPSSKIWVQGQGLLDS